MVQKVRNPEWASDSVKAAVNKFELGNEKVCRMGQPVTGELCQGSSK